MPKLTAQGLAVVQALADTGIRLQDAQEADLHVATLLAEDPEGYPHTYYGFLAPTEIGDPWAFGASLRGDEWADDPSGALWRVEAIGATTAREVFTYEESGLGLLLKIVRTAEAMGGSQAVARLVTLQGQDDLFLEDASGAWWPAGATAPLDNEARDRLIEGYSKLHQQNNDPELAEALNENWQSILKQASSQSQDARLTTESGDLNVAYALARAMRAGVAALAAEPDGAAAPQTEWDATTCHGWWIFRVCFPGVSGALPANAQDIPGGALQNAYYYGYPDKKYKNTALSGAEIENDLIGCGPASFISAAWWLWKHRGVRWYGQAYDGTPPLYTKDSWRNGNITGRRPYKLETPPSRMAEPDENGHALMGRYMGSFEWYGQTATLPSRYVIGARLWLNDQRRNYGTPAVDIQYAFQITPLGFLARDSSSIPGVVFYSTEVSNFVRRAGLSPANPVVALFWIRSPTLNGPHYSAIWKYRVVYYPFFTSVLVWPVDDPDHSYSITNPWGLVRGAFAFVRR